VNARLGPAVKLNYYALCVCVLSERIPEEAFIDMGLVSERKARRASHARVNDLSDETPECVKEMMMLRKTHTWKQIGEIYGISDQAAYQRAKRYSKVREG
jgi:hypothetical protein